MKKKSLRVHGLEDTGDVKVRAKVVAGSETFSECLGVCKKERCQIE